MTKAAPPQCSVWTGAMCHATLSLHTLLSALLFSHQGTTAGSGLICCPQYFPFSLEMLPTQPLPDTLSDSSSTFCFAFVLFKHQSILSSIFLQFVKVFESFSRSLRALAAPLSSVLSADAVRLLHIPLPKPLMKILSNTRPLQCRTQAILQQQTADSFPVCFPSWFGTLQHFSSTMFPHLAPGNAIWKKAFPQPRCTPSPASPLSETCCPVTGKLDWFDIIYSRQSHDLWGYCTPYANAMPLELVSKIPSQLQQGTKPPAPKRDFAVSRFHPAHRSSSNIIALVLMWVSRDLFPVQGYHTQVWALYTPSTIALCAHSPLPPCNCIIWCHITQLVSLGQVQYK